MSTSHVHGRRTAATLVTETGITFTPCDCGRLVGGAGLLARGLATRIATGRLTVTTPHRAGGAYAARAQGGIYSAINAKARLLPLEDQLKRDPRLTPEQGAALYATIKGAYSN